MMRAPEPVDVRGGRECSLCGCTWTMHDLSMENAIEDWCSEPGWLPFPGFPCGCHSPAYAAGLLGLEVVA